jgi:endo-1,4-beta-xylanase
MNRVSPPVSAAPPRAEDLTRRGILGLGAAMLAAPALAQPAVLPLWAAAQRSGILFGASASWNIIRDQAYAGLHRAQSRLLVTDVALKFDHLRPDEATFAFDEADALLAFARAEGMWFRGHTLFWNDNPAPWLKGKSGAEIERIFERHIEIVGARYAGAMQSWDVVNEPFWPLGRTPGGFRPGPWFDAMGEAYIARAFQRLARIDTSAKLVLNEAFTERDDALGRGVRTRMLPLIDRLLDKGVKLDAIGLQAHIQPQIAFDIEAILRFMEEISKRGLKIYISEFDIDDVSLSPDPARRDEEVAAWTTRYLAPVLQNPAIAALITWQLSDRYTWYREPAVVRSHKRRFPARPLPFDEAMAEKPMARAMRAAILAAPPR